MVRIKISKPQARALALPLCLSLIVACDNSDSSENAAETGWPEASAGSLGESSEGTEPDEMDTAANDESANADSNGADSSNAEAGVDDSDDEASGEDEMSEGDEGNNSNGGGFGDSGSGDGGFGDSGSDDSSEGGFGDSGSIGDDSDDGASENTCEGVPDGGLALRSARVGGNAPHFSTIDSHGNEFDFCEHAGDKPILLALSAEWCGPCRSFASYLSTGVGDFPPVKAAVDQGRITMIEVIVDDLTQDFMLSNPLQSIQEWHRRYPNDNVIVAAGRRELVAPFAGADDIVSLPTFVLIDTSYKYEAIGSINSGVLAQAASK